MFPKIPLLTACPDSCHHGAPPADVGGSAPSPLPPSPPSQGRCCRPQSPQQRHLQAAVDPLAHTPPLSAPALGRRAACRLGQLAALRALAAASRRAEAKDINTVSLIEPVLSRQWDPNFKTYCSQQLPTRHHCKSRHRVCSPAGHALLAVLLPLLLPLSCVQCQLQSSDHWHGLLEKA